MRQSGKKIGLFAGLVMAAVALGCQAYPSGVATPRVFVHYGDIQLAPDANLAVTVNFDSAVAKKGYTLKGLADAGIRQIVAKVTGANMVVPATGTVDITGPSCIATISFSDLPTGPVDIVVQALDASGKTVVWGTGHAAVTSGPPAEVTVNCTGDKGGLNVTFQCDQFCQPSPTPTPSPVPTPTPTPANTTSVLGAVNTINVDSKGNLYLIGYDPDYTAPNKVDADRGRVVRILPDTLAIEQPFFADDNVRGIGDGEIAGNDVFNGFVSVQDIIKWDTSTTPGTRLGMIDTPYRLTFGNVVTKDETETIIYNSANPTGMTLFREGALNTQGSLYYNRFLDWNHPFSPTQMAYDYTAKVPIWTCKAGIATIQDFNADPAVALSSAADLGGKVTRAVATGGPGSTKVLFSELGEIFKGDGNVYLWDKTKGKTVTVAATFANQVVVIEHGRDGYFYVLLYGPSGNYGLASSHYQVVKCRLVGDTLEPMLTMVDTL